ncbi:MAG: hypothetical protein KIT00_11225, partial [Rhodospirillales bacterium]|nr:hypothetical protein [Rhodospirillales bacterium]
MFGGVDLGGAGQRLLPEDIPLRFFGSAAGFHILAWGGLLLTAPEVPGFIGGPGPVLAAVHTLTLGVLLMTAFGASFQMLPVALGKEAPPALACNAAFALLLIGATLLIAGFALYEMLAIQVGATATAAAVAVYVSTMARLIWGTAEVRTVVLYAWVALISLAIAAGFGVTLGFDYTFDLLPDHANVALAHLLLAGYGFMGMLALGLSQVVIPLFAVALVPYERWALISLWLAVAALVLSVVGNLLGMELLVAAAIVAGLGAAGFHIRMMTDLLAKRLRKRLSSEFVLIRASWVIMPVPMVVGTGLLVDILPATAPALFGFTLLFGWLLTLLVGVLQRIIPLLASMHTGRLGRVPAAPSHLTAEKPLQVHRWCHLAALVIVAIGISIDVAEIVRAGAAVGMIGAVAFAVFT